MTTTVQEYQDALQVVMKMKKSELALYCEEMLQSKAQLSKSELYKPYKRTLSLIEDLEKTYDYISNLEGVKEPRADKQTIGSATLGKSEW